MASGNVLRIAAFASPADNWQAAIAGFGSRCKARNLSVNTVGYDDFRLEAFLRYLDSNAPGTTPREVPPTCGSVKETSWRDTG